MRVRGIRTSVPLDGFAAGKIAEEKIRIRHGLSHLTFDNFNPFHILAIQVGMKPMTIGLLMNYRPTY
jgi:hypothetical protein